MLRTPLLGLLGAGFSLSAATAGIVTTRSASTLPKVYFDVEADGKNLGRIVFQVFRFCLFFFLLIFSLLQFSYRIRCLNIF